MVAAAVLVAAVCVLGTPSIGGAATVSAPDSPVGLQLQWLLGAMATLPLGSADIEAHFDTLFLAKVPPTTLNGVLASLDQVGAPQLVSLSDVTPTSLEALVGIGAADYDMELSVDSAGLIDGLLFTNGDKEPTTWSAVDRQLSAVAPGVSFLAARVGPGGTCTAVHSILPDRPRPLGSMFKLFVLGALANAVHDDRISWDQMVTVTAGIKVGGSGTLQNEPDGTTLTVQQAATDMISVSDNTAADLLLALVGRAAVERQVRRWSSRPSLDIPFLTVSELFALKYGDYPAMARHYLSLGPSSRAAYLRSTVDALSAADEVSSAAPRDINSIEWFASADDLCRAFTGLAALEAEPGLHPIDTVLSTNDGGIGLNKADWPRVWFKGGSEAGVLTLGYLARDASGHTFVVIALTENPAKAFDQQTSALRLLAVISGAFGLLR
jgi:beta-lactamase class A